MSIDQFVAEIQNRKKNELADLDKKLNDKKSEIDAKKILLLRSLRRTMPTRQRQKQKEKVQE